MWIYLLLQTKCKGTFTHIQHGGAREIHGEVWTHGKIFITYHHPISIAMPLKQLFFQDLILCNSVDLFNHHKRIQYLRLPVSLGENKLNVYFVWVKYVFNICICVHLYVQCVHFLLKQLLSRISVHILFI